MKPILLPWVKSFELNSFERNTISRKRICYTFFLSTTNQYGITIMSNPLTIGVIKDIGYSHIIRPGTVSFSPAIKFNSIQDCMTEVDKFLKNHFCFLDSRLENFL